MDLWSVSGECSSAASLNCCRACIADFRYYYFGAGSDNNEDRAKAKAFALPGSTHAGFTSLAVALWRGGLRTLLDASVEGGVTHVSVAGHSLGAGVATLLSYRMQVRSPTLREVPPAPAQGTLGILVRPGRMSSVLLDALSPTCLDC